MMKDISWGAIILGAAAVTAIAAVSLSTGGVLAGVSLLAANQGATLAGAAVAGGVLGNMASKLMHRVQDSATTLVER